MSSNELKFCQTFYFHNIFFLEFTSILRIALKLKKPHFYLVTVYHVYNYILRHFIIFFVSSSGIRKFIFRSRGCNFKFECKSADITPAISKFNYLSRKLFCFGFNHKFEFQILHLYIEYLPRCLMFIIQFRLYQSFDFISNIINDFR